MAPAATRAAFDRRAGAPISGMAGSEVVSPRDHNVYTSADPRGNRSSILPPGGFPPVRRALAEHQQVYPGRYSRCGQLIETGVTHAWRLWYLQMLLNAAALQRRESISERPQDGDRRNLLPESLAKQAMEAEYRHLFTAEFASMSEAAGRGVACHPGSADDPGGDPGRAGTASPDRGVLRIIDAT